MNQTDNLLKIIFNDAEAIKTFKKQGNKGDMISKIWETPFFQNFLRNESERLYNKSEGDSRRHRETGNRAYMAGNDAEAIKCFNKAILKAPQDEEGRGRDYSLALANRSASLLRLGHFTLCQHQVDLALAAGYPPDLRYKLIERKIILCQYRGQDSDELKKEFIKALKESKLTEDKRQQHIREIENLKLKELPGEISEEAILSHSLTDFHPHLKSFSNKIDIKYEKNRGRFAVANCSIPVGSVILVESPHASIVKNSHEKDLCENCMQNVLLSFVPCKKCANVKFCSTKCREESSGYHDLECGMRDMYGTILNNVTAISQGRTSFGDTNDYSRLALRVITRHPLSWHSKQQQTRKHFNVNSSDLTSSHGIWNLVSHEHKVSDSRLWWFLISAVCNLRILQLSGFFGKTKPRVSPVLTDSEVMIGGMMVELLLCLQFNTHSVTESTDSLNVNKKLGMFDNKIRPIGSAIYPNFALVNHSCDQNTYKYFAGNKLVVVASKNISVGEEVTENYFPMAQVIPRPERRSWLSQHYWFDCLCSACHTNIPTIEKISTTCSNIVCGLNHCSGLLSVSDGGECLVCGSKSEGVQIKKRQIKELETKLEQLRLSLDSNMKNEQKLDHFEEIKEVWGRLDSMVTHPYKGLYIGEQVFWKALRMAYGNQAKPEL